MTVNKRVREIRKSKGITQVFVARQLGVSAQTYNAYELQRKDLQAGTLRRIAEILNEPIENFFKQEIYESKKSETA